MATFMPELPMVDSVDPSSLLVHVWPETTMFNIDNVLSRIGDEPSPSAASMFPPVDATDARPTAITPLAFDDSAAELHNTADDMFSSEATLTLAAPKANDSGVDLPNQTTWPPHHQPPLLDTANVVMHNRTTSDPVSSSSLIYSADHSPINHSFDFLLDHSQPSSPDDALEMNPVKDASTPDLSSSCEAIMMPRSVDCPAKLHIVADKNKTRAETQIRANLVLDPGHYDYVRFPLETLSKPKQFADEPLLAEIQGRSIAQIRASLVCASAIDTPEGRERAIRRTMGLEPFPRRDSKVQITELEKDDERHPQNGGQVVICEGCKERERKRFDRKKKKTVDDGQFQKYENDRVIIINEKEYKKFEDVDTAKEMGLENFPKTAKRVPFNLRLSCYGRHQGDASQGFCVVFVLVDMKTEELIAATASETFHVTDDHKTKEMTISIPQTPQPQPQPQPQAQAQAQAQVYHVAVPQQTPTYNAFYQPGLMPMGVYSPDAQYTNQAAFSQPTTPVLTTNYHTPLSPLDGSMHHGMAQLAVHQQQHQTSPMAQFTSPPSATTGSFSHGLPQHYNNNMLNFMPMGAISNGLTRPQSMDSFANFQNPYNMQQDYIAQSAPPSLSNTPRAGLSRPASPSFDDGLPAKRQHRGYLPPRQDGL